VIKIYPWCEDSEMKTIFRSGHGCIVSGLDGLVEHEAVGILHWNLADHLGVGVFQGNTDLCQEDDISLILIKEQYQKHGSPEL
jgi:hypothetical protein